MQKTRRATEAVEDHYEYLRACQTGSAKDSIEGGLLDVTKDPNDPRYGHEKFLFGEVGSFQGWVKEIVNSAQTFTATTDLWREVNLTIEMLMEENIEWLPLKEHHVPTTSGFMIFPYGIKCPVHKDYGINKKKINGEMWLIDDGGGTEWWIDGFFWDVNDKVSRDGVAGAPQRGVTVIPLTRWRGNVEHRPFRAHFGSGRDPKQVPHLVGSDLTAWAFDLEGQYEWPELEPQSAGAAFKNKVDERSISLEDAQEDLIQSRAWFRSMIWSTFRWLSEEVWLSERPERNTIRKMQRARAPIHTNPPREDGSIVVVDLRLERKEAIAKGESGGDPPWWRSRWIVRGHWARRRFAIRDEDGNAVGPTKGEGAVEGQTYYYKKVFIEPHEKGPDNAPLILKDRVGVLSR